MFYCYVQEPLLATSGTYVWYLVALDWRSGEEVYRIKARASGVFNDNFVASSIGPNGGFYQPVIRGVFIVKDRQEGKHEVPQQINHNGPSVSPD